MSGVHGIDTGVEEDGVGGLLIIMRAGERNSRRQEKANQYSKSILHECPRNHSRARAPSTSLRAGPRHTCSERRRRIYPQHHRVRATRIAPLVRYGAFEIKAVAGL